MEKVARAACAARHYRRVRAFLAYRGFCGTVGEGSDPRDSPPWRPSDRNDNLERAYAEARYRRCGGSGACIERLHHAERAEKSACLVVHAGRVSRCILWCGSSDSVFRRGDTGQRRGDVLCADRDKSRARDALRVRGGDGDDCCHPRHLAPAGHDPRDHGSRRRCAQFDVHRRHGAHPVFLR